MMMRLLACFALVAHVGAVHRQPSDVNLSWPTGGGHGACVGPAVQGNDVITVNGNDITLTTDAAPNLTNGSCVFRNAQPSITLEEYPNIEVDLKTSGSHAAPPGLHGGMWFSFWMYPPQSAYRYTPPESGEVDFVENINSVRTNFAGCAHNCQETEWNQSPINVSAHITMKYDYDSETVSVYRCKHGSDTCDTSGFAATILLKAFQNPKPYQYTFSADVWYAKPGYNFKFEVSNLRILRDRTRAKCSTHAGCKGLPGNCCPADDGTMLACCGSKTNSSIMV